MDLFDESNWNDWSENDDGLILTGLDVADSQISDLDINSPAVKARTARARQFAYRHRQRQRDRLDNALSAPYSTGKPTSPLAGGATASAACSSGTCLFTVTKHAAYLF